MPKGRKKKSGASKASNPAPVPPPLVEPQKFVNTDDPCTMVIVCSERGLTELLVSLIQSENIPLEVLEHGLLLAAENGHLRVVLFLIKYVSISCVNERGETALALAARHGHLEVATALIKNGAFVDARAADGTTPLFTAVEYNQEEVVAFLIEMRANVNIPDYHRNSILHVAASSGYVELALLLCRAGACANVLNDDNEAPIEVAKTSEVCRLLLEFQSNYGDLDFEREAERQQRLLVDPHNLDTACSPFRELPAGPASYLFWTAMGVGKDSYMFQNFGVYPFDRLNDTERIIVLTEVAEAMSGYKADPVCNILNESALYAVFALMKARIKKELEDSEANHSAGSGDSYLWRQRVLDAFEQVYNANAALCGLSVETLQRSVWNTVVNLLARSLFGESFWEKKRMFLSPNALERAFLLTRWHLPAGYCDCPLPSTASIEIQLTFKKLITMSKTFLCDEPVRPSGCFCQDCITELEVPLTFKLQFLEEAAEEKRKIKKGKGKGAREAKKGAGAIAAKGAFGSVGSAVGSLPGPGAVSSRKQLDSLALSHHRELKVFWAALTIEEKWCLTEMTTVELSDLISQCQLGGVAGRAGKLRQIPLGG